MATARKARDLGDACDIISPSAEVLNLNLFVQPKARSVALEGLRAQPSNLFKGPRRPMQPSGASHWPASCK